MAGGELTEQASPERSDWCRVLQQIKASSYSFTESVEQLGILWKTFIRGRYDSSLEETSKTEKDKYYAYLLG